VSRYRETEPETEHVPEPPELNLSDLPTIDGRAGVVALAAEWGVPLTENRVKRATESGHLPRFIVCAKLRYSSRDVWRWLYGMRGTVGSANRAGWVSA
jgi:hypothetical protein